MTAEKEKRLHTMQLGIFMVEVHTSWNDSALVFEDRTGDGAPRRCTVRIGSPSDVAYLREKLNEIEAGWRASLDAIKVGA